MISIKACRMLNEPAALYVHGVANPKLSEAIGHVPTATLVSGSSLWRVSVFHHQQLAEVIAKHTKVFEIVPDLILNLLKPRAWPTVHIETAIPLMPFQKEGVEFIMSHRGRGIIADGMGLGKTIQGIALIEQYPQLRPVVIVCPAAVKGNWKNHVRKYLGEDPKMMNSYKSKFNFAGINIISYSLCASQAFESGLKLFQPKLIILDESHYIKNMKSKRTKCAFRWSQQADVCVLLTGTPMNRCVELYSQIKCVNPRMFAKFFHYQKHGRLTGVQTNVNKFDFFYATRYCKPELKYAYGTEKLVFRGSENETELHAVLREHVMIRRTKEEVLKDLPLKTREKVIIDEWKQVKPMDFSTDSAFMALILDTSQRKIPYIKKYIQEILIEELKNDDTLKILCWGYYHSMIDAIHDSFQESKIQCVKMDGRTSQAEREDIIADFQRSPDVRVAVLGLGSMNSGITLTAATLSVVMELALTPDIHLQAEDRCHRIGQSMPVTIRYLVCDGSTDDIVWRMLENKVKSTGLVIDNQAAEWDPDGPRSSKRQKIENSIDTTCLDAL